jgi:ankyrin repeat protein
MVCVLGADVNAAHAATGWTPLHYACHYDHESVIRYGCG